MDSLVRQGHAVRIYDNLTEQVHRGRAPAYMNRNAEFIRGDVCDAAALSAALDGIDAVAHLAAAVGVAQSNYEVRRYVETNCVGTATLFDALIKGGLRPRVVVPGSMVCYGEGMYERVDGLPVRPPIRTRDAIRVHGWEPVDPETSTTLVPVPTPEDASQHLGSIYSLTKHDQERMTLRLGALHNIPVAVLRFFNVYGPRQSLSNPYTGVTAIFMARLKNGRQPVIYEDGHQSRDFVSVHDAVRAVIAALESATPAGAVYNIGSGEPARIVDLARMMAHACGAQIEPNVTGEFRDGDIRHCFADIGRAHRNLGFQPEVPLAEGIDELVGWAETEEAVDLYEQAEAELRRAGIL